ncbi:formate dehydrogenase accessory sulfurtransferase FdhD [Polynucleobacter victoriensis]|nr:formate dehydrogenase accessory sulfurtransferase FdhD [Polynucleobacter victoriensis]
MDEQGRKKIGHIPGERPLTIYLDKKELVTLMTMGGAPEALVLGYLRNQRLVSSVGVIESIQVDWETESAAVKTKCNTVDVEQKTSRRVVTTGCGQGTVFGGLLDDIDKIHLSETAQINQLAVYEVVDHIRTKPSIYKQAGSVHACAVFKNCGDHAELLHFVEDVGRHNAVDSIAGLMWLEDQPGDDLIFYTTGRLTSEMVIKGAQMGIPFLLSRSGVTAMGLEMANKLNLTLFGRCSGQHYLIYSGINRFIGNTSDVHTA